MTSQSLATLLFAAHFVLSVAELTGENVCHKRQTYTVTMRVVVKEPMQVKTYTWCLKVPPRCTKFKVEMRDRFKVQTELRERVVDMCCPGYAPDKTAKRCVPVCSGCGHGTCANPNTCHCEPGYVGDRCDIECPEGLWDSACGQKCQCQNGATCNNVTGECICAEGWTGARCDTICPEGTYGRDCTKECACKATGDSDNSECHHVTGECTLSGTTQKDNEPSDVHHPKTVLPDDNEEVSDTDTHSTLQPTEHFVLEVQDVTTPIAEINTVSIDKKFTAVIKTTPISTTMTSPITTEQAVKQEISNEDISNSVTNTVPLHDDQHSELDSVTERRQVHDTNVLREDQASETTQAYIQPHTIQMHPNSRPIIVISDSLLSERRDGKMNEESKNGVLYLVFIVSVTGFVAVSLIIMATAILWLSRHRSKAKVAVAESEMASVSKQQHEEQQPTAAPQMYGYTEDVTTCPVQHLFPNTKLKPSNGVPGPHALPLSFGDVTSTMATNSNFGQSYHLYNNTRAYLELQYDIPSSSFSSRSNSLPPGMELEHLYDEIPCWQSTTTTTASTKTDSSGC